MCFHPFSLLPAKCLCFRRRPVVPAALRCRKLSRRAPHQTHDLSMPDISDTRCCANTRQTTPTTPCTIDSAQEPPEEVEHTANSRKLVSIPVSPKATCGKEPRYSTVNNFSPVSSRGLRGGPESHPYSLFWYADPNLSTIYFSSRGMTKPHR